MTKAPGNWQAMATVGAALLGLCGVIFSAMVSSKSTYDSSVNAARTEAIVEQINEKILPMLQKQLDSTQNDLKTISSAVMSLKDRIITLEQRGKSNVKISADEYRDLMRVMEFKTNKVELPLIKQGQVFPYEEK